MVSAHGRAIRRSTLQQSVRSVEIRSVEFQELDRNGLLKVYNVSLKRCIRYAYGMPETQILGGPKWVDDVRYDILAKADQPLKEPELLKMLQPLLADRFKLAFHRETRPIAGYVLTAAKGGITAKVADASAHSGANGARGRIDTSATPVSDARGRCPSSRGKLG